MQSQEDDSIFLSVDEGTAVYINDIKSTEGNYVWRKGNNRYWGSAQMLADDFALYQNVLTEDDVLKEYLGSISENDLTALIENAKELLKEPEEPTPEKPTPEKPTPEKPTPEEPTSESPTQESSTGNSQNSDKGLSGGNTPPTGDNVIWLRYVILCTAAFVYISKKAKMNKN